jgi:anti-sigma regulatory factor (Ser/Thr protein kinase)
MIVTEPAPRTTSITLPATAESVRAARSAVRQQLAAALPPARRESAELLVSELATNAVRHAGDEFTIVLDVSEPRVRVEVHDPDPRGPQVREPRSDETSGRGMQLVSRLADRWGTAPSEPGKAVWSELDG